MKKIIFATLKKILCNLTQQNSTFHTTPELCSKRFTRCNKCGQEYQKFKDNCCPLTPIPKRPAVDPFPKEKSNTKKAMICSGGMMHHCLKDAYKHKCALTKFRTSNCPPKQLPPCPKGDWNREDP